MSTVNKTQSTNQYNSGSMGVFNQLNPAFGSAIQSEINNPYNNMAFNTQLQMQNRMNQTQFGSQQSAMMQRMQAMGQNPNSAFFQSQLGKMQRGNQANQSQGYNNLLLQASQLRQNAIGQAGAYRPLQTGQTQTQSQSGLGTWLPQVAGMAMGAATMGMTGGMSGGGGGGSFFSGAGAHPMNPAGSFFGGAAQAPDMGPSNYVPGMTGQSYNPFMPGQG